MDALQSLVLDLNQLIPILNHWLHLISAVIWIGGLAFLVMAVTPGLKKAVARTDQAHHRQFLPAL